ncbi:MAG: flagellar biosynthetic protein FliR [Ignavibacteria bacterium]|nr:flagellar biosynthetic protein FliR [Ignavibacteria bacterium]
MFDTAFLQLTQEKLIIGILVLARISGIFTAGHFYGNLAIPIPVKIMLILIITMILAPTCFADAPHIDFNILNMFFLLFKEFLIGAILGFATNIVYWAARFGGGITDMDMGYQASLMFDQEAGAPTLVGEFYALSAMMIFLYMQGHHFVIETLVLSIKAVPLTTFLMTESTLKMLFLIVSSFMMLGLKMAAPVLITLFNMNLALTMLARVAPQMNIFMLSFQVKIAVGLLILFVAVPIVGVVSKQALNIMEIEITKLLLTFNPALAN